MSQNARMVSFLAPASLIEDVEALVQEGTFTHMSDAWRGVSRNGVEVEHGRKKKV